MASTFVLSYDGTERYVTGDAVPGTKRIVRIQKPGDDRRGRDDMALLGEDMVRYQVVSTSQEMWERYPGQFEGVTVVEMERVVDAES